MLKRFLAGLLCLLLLPLAVYAEEAAASPVMEKKTFPHLYVYDKKDEPAEEQMNLYFTDGGDIPYAALSEYVPFLNRVANRVHEAEIPLEFHYYDQTGLFSVERTDNGSAMIVNPAGRTIAFDNYNSFLQAPGSSALVDILDLPDPRKNNLDFNAMLGMILANQDELANMSEEQMKDKFSEMLDGFLLQEPEKENSFFVATRLTNRRGDPVSLRLADYDIEIITDGGECYLPFQMLNNLLISPLYVQYIFNGQQIIGDVYGGTLTERAYEAEPAPMSESFALYNYNELRLFLDTFYGLKPEHRINSFFNYLVFNTSLNDALMGTDPNAFDDALSELMTTCLDDSHSGLVRKSWRNNASPEAAGMDLFFNVLNGMGYTTMSRLQAAGRLSRASRQFYPDGIPPYEEIGDTAFVTFDSFTADRSPEEYYRLENPDDPKDTVELILYAHRQVTREGSPIKNIVLDLSQNGGGNSSAAAAVAAWFTGEAVFQLRDTMTGAETIEGFRADLNLNNKIANDPGDSVSGGEYHLYCLTSPVSFSCANLVPAIFKQSGIVTLIGQRSGGGANAVLPAVTASGTLFRISGTKQISTSINGSFYNVDTGVEPDVILTRPESFYNRPALVEMINSLK